ncbi:MAG: hypothetical protein EAX96_15720 [Candidatus Lokiarchaeota archaeon]|nr:hypothetical protein [Candidatus Lokiarchaeota archaeon]
MKKGKYKFLPPILSIFMILLIFSSSFIPVSAIRVAWNYSNTDAEDYRSVNDDTNGDEQSLRIAFNMGEGQSIIVGVRYWYNVSGSGSDDHSMDIRFEGDSYWVGYSDTNIPHVNGTYRNFVCVGPTYLLDDDPVVYFIGNEPSTDCVLILGDTPSIGNSQYNNGSGWTTDSMEYLVMLYYEWVNSTAVDEVVAGSITTTDNWVDAYSVSLTAGITYNFSLEKTSGTGSLDMRLNPDQDLTNNDLVTGTETMSYTPSTSGTYILLVEAVTPFSDAANYTVTYSAIPSITNVDSPLADGTYMTGEVIPINIQFTETVTVTGTPQLTLETGTTDAVVDYKEGSGSNTLTFNYTIASGEISTDLAYININALSLNGGSIKDSNGNDAFLTLPTPGSAGSLSYNKNLKINYFNIVPILSDGKVTPTTGTSSTTFKFSVKYTDANNETPSYIRVYIDGLSYDMVKQDEADSTYNDGCIYEYSTTLNTASHEYYFTASDGTDMARYPSTGTLSGPFLNQTEPPPDGGVSQQIPGFTIPVIIFSIIMLIAIFSWSNNKNFSKKRTLKLLK